MIFHITTRKQWKEAILLGTYRASSLDDEGFIHCSTQQQILRSANEYYYGQPDLVMLCISSSKVEAPIVYEDSYKKGEFFPHIYGTLNLDAVMQAFDFPPNRTGLFSLPDDFHSQCHS
jgi:uncharacterized protein (DUF952 family)